VGTYEKFKAFHDSELLQPHASEELIYDACTFNMNSYYTECF